MKTTLPAPDTVNPLFEGLKQLVRQAVREELQNSLIARNGKPEKLLFDTEEAAQFLGRSAHLARIDGAGAKNQKHQVGSLRSIRADGLGSVHSGEKRNRERIRSNMSHYERADLGTLTVEKFTNGV